MDNLLERPDFIIIAVYLVISVGFGIWFVRRGTKDTKAYFAGSGAIPWWVAGTSLLVACFAADTPIWIGNVVYKYGIQGVWLYWAPAIGTAFFILLIAPLWKRSGIMTDIEFLELRYSGHAAPVMRFLNSLFYSGFVSIMFMSLQTLSMVKYLLVSMDWSGPVEYFTNLTANMPMFDGVPWDKLLCVIIVMVFAASYSVISGLWGVAGSGAMQFAITYIGSVILAIFVITHQEVGGISGMVEKLRGLQDWPQGNSLNILPNDFSATTLGLPAMTLFALVLFRWTEQAGMGQYVAQRLIATKNSRSAVYTAMIWGIGFFAIVPLPWILTVLAGKILRPGLTDGELVYPEMIMMLPAGLKGVLIAAMLAAFMSTYSSLMSWGSSYFVNDFYRRFLVRKHSEKHYVRMGQMFMIVMAIAAGVMAMKFDSVLGIVFIVLEFMSGYWTVMFLRWVWWRVNAWAEVAALSSGIAIAWLLRILAAAVDQPGEAASGFANMIVKLQGENYWGHRIMIVCGGALIIWMIVMLLTKKPSDEVLDRFYKKVHPPGFWGPVRKRLNMEPSVSAGGILYCWILMVIAIYCPLVGLLKIFLGNARLGFPLTIMGLIAVVLAVMKTHSLYSDTREARFEAQAEDVTE